jgi:S1-C subfamily serine protease
LAWGDREFGCIDPKNLVNTSDSFGVELLADVDTKGAAVIKVVPGSTGAKAGLKHLDVVIEYADRSIDTAAALRAAISDTPTGARVLIKLHRNQQEMAVTAQF